MLEDLTGARRESDVVILIYRLSMSSNISKFYSGRSCALLGTQRSLARWIRGEREALGTTAAHVWALSVTPPESEGPEGREASVVPLRDVGQGYLLGTHSGVCQAEQVSPFPTVPTWQDSEQSLATIGAPGVTTVCGII